MQKSAEAVDVDLDVVTLLGKDFRGEVSVSANLKSSLIGGALELVGASEVTKLESCIGGHIRDKDVLHLDVAVNDVSIVEFFESSSHLLDHVLCVLLSERLVWLLADILEEVASFEKLSHDAVVLLILEGLEHHNQVVAVKLRESLAEFEFDEFLAVGFESLCNLLLADNFNGNVSL